MRRRLKEIEGWDWHKARIWLLLRELARELMRMELNVMEDAELRRLVVELSDKWRSLTRHKSARGLPETNREKQDKIPLGEYDPGAGQASQAVQAHHRERTALTCRSGICSSIEVVE